MAVLLLQRPSVVLCNHWQSNQNTESLLHLRGLELCNMCVFGQISRHELHFHTQGGRHSFPTFLGACA